jgi:hypothetical protein
MSPVILDPAAVLDRPGVGLVISSAETFTNPARGVVGYLGRARQGPLNTPIRCTNVAQIVRTFGGAPYGPGLGNSMDGAMHALRGGAVAVWVVRMGSGGVAASLSLEDEEGDTAVRVEAQGAGQDGNRLAVGLLGAADDATRELVVVEDGIEREHLRYSPGSHDAAALMDAYARLGSDLITLSLLPDASDEPLAESPVTSLLGGTNPTISFTDIADGLAALGGRPFEIATVDFVENEEADLFVETLNDWIAGGKLSLGTIGSPPGMPWGPRMTRARAINNPALTYVANGFISNVRFPGQSNFRVEGYEAAGREAGRLAALRLAQQLTHSVINDGVSTIDEPPPDVIASALAAGVYLYSSNSRGQVWTEQGLTTQSDTDRPPPWARQTDSGWRKQRLVLTRFRLLTDIELAVSPMIETTTNNAAGRESVRRQMQNVIDGAYVPSGAVEAGTLVQLHPEFPPTLDRATYLIAPLITPDGVEFIVIEAQFRR